MQVRDFFSWLDCYTTALAADIFMRGRWTDSEYATMFGHVARQSASIYDDSRAGWLILLSAAKMFRKHAIANVSKSEIINVKAIKK